jgi:hypothetical protein
MKQDRVFWFAGRLSACVAACLAFVLLLMLPNTERVARAALRVELVVVVAKSSSVQDISLSELRRVYTTEGDRDASGQRYVPFNHRPHTPDRVAFDQIVLGMSPDEVSKFWIDRKIRGMPGPPHSADSLPLLLRLVASLPGAIGYARPALLTAEVRAVRVNGKLPNEPGYPLVFSE